MSTKITTGDSVINYEYVKCDNPKADTILLVHGLGLDLTIWDESVPFFSTEYNVLRYDIRGHGKSLILKNKDFSWELLINDLDILLKELSIKEAHFVGHSGSGNFGLEVVKHTNIINSLTLISTPIRPPKASTRYEIESRESRGTSKKLEDIVMPIAKTICFPSTEMKINRLVNIYKQVSFTTYLDYFHLTSNTILNYSIDDFQNNVLPVLLLSGEYDVLYPPELHLMTLNQIKNSKLYVIPDSANCVMIDQPEIFSKYTKKFIESVRNNRKTQQNYTYTESLMKEIQSIVNSGILENQSQDIIHLNMIEYFKVIIDGKEILGKWNQRKAKQIFAYIIYHKSVTREQLYDIFWADYELIKARNYLRVSLNHIKALIEESTGKAIENYLIIERDTISVKCQTRFDLMELLENIGKIENESNYSKKLSMALLVFGALPDIICNGIYDDWVLSIRTKIENTIIDVCEELLDVPMSDEDRIDLLKILIKFNPTEELYYVQLTPLLKNLGKQKDLEDINRKRKLAEEMY